MSEYAVEMCHGGNLTRTSDIAEDIVPGAAYGESTDGLNWKRSDRVVPLMKEGTVWRDDDEPDSSRRYASNQTASHW